MLQDLNPKAVEEYESKTGVLTRRMTTNLDTSFRKRGTSTKKLNKLSVPQKTTSTLDLFNSYRVCDYDMPQPKPDSGYANNHKLSRVTFKDLSP